MRVYKLKSVEEVQRLEVSPDEKVFAHSAMDPKQIGDLQGYEFEHAFLHTGGKLKLMDISFVQSYRTLPVFVQRVAKLIKSECGISDHWHPLTVEGQSYELLNLVDVVDAVDDTTSEIIYWSPVPQVTDNKPGVKSFDVLSFNPAVVENQFLFRDRTLASFNLFCTDKFVEFAKDVNITGLSLQPVWDSEYQPFSSAPKNEEVLARPEIYGPDGFVDGYKQFF